MRKERERRERKGKGERRKGDRGEKRREKEEEGRRGERRGEKEEGGERGKSQNLQTNLATSRTPNHWGSCQLDQGSSPSSCVLQIGNEKDICKSGATIGHHLCCGPHVAQDHAHFSLARSPSVDGGDAGH